jgi:hypothetical protein
VALERSTSSPSNTLRNPDSLLGNDGYIPSFANSSERKLSFGKDTKESITSYNKIIKKK